MKSLPVLATLILLSLVGQSEVSKIGFLTRWRDKIADKMDFFHWLKFWKTRMLTKEIKHLTKQMRAVNSYLLSLDESLDRFLLTYRRFVSLVAAHQKLARLGVVLFSLIIVHEQRGLEQMIDDNSYRIIQSIENATRHVDMRKLEISLDQSLINLRNIHDIVQNRWTNQ